MNNIIEIPSVVIPGTGYALDGEVVGVGVVLLIISIAFFLNIIISKIVEIFKNAKYKTQILTPKLELNFTKGQEAIDFLERLIKEKYNYYMYLELLPIYLDRKIPEKNIIKTIREKIYVSVVGSLTRNVKEEMLKYFTEKGIEIFVNEKIIILMNETDFRAAEKFTEEFREINMSNIDKLL